VASLDAMVNKIMKDLPLNFILSSRFGAKSQKLVHGHHIVTPVRVKNSVNSPNAELHWYILHQWTWKCTSPMMMSNTFCII